MANEDKIDAYVFKIKTEDKDVFPEEVLVIEDVQICNGTWIVGIVDRIEGILQGLELANYPSNKIEITIVDAELKQNFDAEKLMEHVRT